jgi:hypothetical protein
MSKFDEMASYLRNIRPPNDYMSFDRMVRAILFWFDTHRIKEPQVFFEQEGKEWQAFLAYLTSELGELPPLLTKDFVKSMSGFASATR